MTEQEMVYTMALTRTPRISLVAQHRLMQAAGSATAVYEHRHHIRELLPEATPRLAEAMPQMEQQLDRARRELDYAREKKVEVLCLNDMDYPARLRECNDAPIVLYYKGNARLNRSHMVGVVGTRHSTEYGKDICRHLAAELKRLCPDTVVVSGLAYGIDINAHRAALDNGLDTIGVLAHGLDRIYPRMHRDTAVAMLQQGGLLTEFMSGTNADKMNFVRRNRIVAGMTEAIVVVESAQKGGALITADLALDYNHSVFAYPGRVTDTYSVGCNNLIRDNKAALINDAQELAQALGWCQAEARRPLAQPSLFDDLSPEEQLLADSMEGEDGITASTIAMRSGLPVSQVTALLFGMEMKGAVRLLGGGNYRLT